MQSIDLNLLAALDALLSEGSVTAAAERMNLSVPAMSRTLNRVRTLVGDPLLVRAGRGLVPTPRAEALRDGVHELMQQAQLLLRQSEDFDLAALRRVFTIRADDGLVSSFGPILLDLLMTAAPGVQIRFVAQGQQDVAALREGLIDLDVGVIADIGPEIVRQQLFQDRFVAVFRAGHPLQALAELNPQRFAEHAHVTVSRRGLTRGPVDEALAGLGLSRRIVAVAASFAEALAIARETDLVATVAERLTQPMRRGMHTLALPVPTAPVTISQAWHPRFGNDAGHRAIRSLLRQACQQAR